MSISAVTRYTYLLGWAFGILAVLYRGLELLGVKAVNVAHVTSRGVLSFAGFLFVACIASCLYAQATQAVPREKAKGAAA